MRDLREVTTVVFEGGGVAGMGEAGAWKVIADEMNKQGAHPNTFGGTSAGAILAMLCALNYTPKQLRATMDATPWKEFMPSEWGVFRDLWNAITTGAYSSLEYAEGWLSERIHDAALSPYTTFAELLRYRSTSLKVVATDEAAMRPVLFSPDATPDAPIRRAVLASMAIPEVWPSVLIDGTPHCDGGVFANFPLRLVAEHLPAEQVIGICIDYAGEGKVRPYGKRGWTRARRILHALRHGQRVHHPSHLYPSRVVVVDRPKWAGATAFKLSETKRTVLWQNGEFAARKWVKVDEKS